MACHSQVDLEIIRIENKTTNLSIPSSILTCVMGFPAGSYIGLAFTSIFEVEMPGRSAPDIWVAPLVGVSFLAAGFDAPSPVAVRCPIFRISLYFG